MFPSSFTNGLVIKLPSTLPPPSSTLHSAFLSIPQCVSDHLQEFQDVLQSNEVIAAPPHGHGHTGRTFSVFGTPKRPYRFLIPTPSPHPLSESCSIGLAAPVRNPRFPPGTDKGTCAKGTQLRGGRRCFWRRMRWLLACHTIRSTAPAHSVSVEIPHPHRERNHHRY